MLVTFSCEAHSNIVMFSDVAQQLLRKMGYDGSKPGVIIASEVPAALERLQSLNTTNNTKTNNNKDEQPVSLSQRAFPLIELLNAAAKDECYVSWEIK